MATEIVMPKLGMVMTEGIVAKWTKTAGDKVSQGEVIAEIETEKLNYELEAIKDGILHHIASEGVVVKVNGLMGYLLDDGESVPESSQTTDNPTIGKTSGQAPVAKRPRSPKVSGTTIPSTPGARKLAAKLGIDLGKVTPTGPRGRVVEADIRAFTENDVASARSTSGSSSDEATAAMLATLPPTSKVVKMSGMRKGIADHMRGSLQSTAQLTFTLEIPVTELQRRRKEWSRTNKKPVTNTHVYTKACALVIKDMPAINTVLIDENVHYFDQIDIGVAVSLDEGLIVPVIRDVANVSLEEIAKQTSEMTKRAQAGSLSPDEMAGGTFTISVLGTVDGFTPILNRGQSAILGVGGTRQKPVVEQGEVAVRDVCTFNLTVDHQTIDGAVAAEFMKRFAELIQSPEPLFP